MTGDGAAKLQGIHLQVGYVSRAHGLRGEIEVKTFDPASEVLFEVSRVHLRMRSGEERTFEVEECRTSAKELLLALKTVRTREKAQPLVGSTLFVFRADLKPPEQGEYFLGDLLGLEARSEAGASLGRVEEVMDSGPVPNLVIRDGAGVEHLLPFADDFVLDVNLERRCVIVRLPEWVE